MIDGRLLTTSTEEMERCYSIPLHTRQTTAYGNQQLVNYNVKRNSPQITGAGHGMGREVALRFAKLGATIVCVDINPAGNHETVDMIKKAKGVAHSYE